MLKKGTLLILSGCLLVVMAYAQKQENIWIMGEQGGVGLDFNAGSPPDSIAPPGYFASYEAAASICDATTGQLLFYTDGDTIYNKNGSAMPNGRGLTGIMPVTGPGQSATASAGQGALIVPMPGDREKYYVFSLTDCNSFIYAKILAPGLYADQSGFLYYSIVDMSLDGGLGDVITGKKGIPLDTTTRFTEHMIGVAGNNCNVWVVLLDPQKETSSISRFKSFEVTANAVHDTPVISNVFSVSQSTAPYASLTGFGQPVGHLNISPDRTKLALAVGSSYTKQRLTLFDFDANTGMVSNPLILDTAYTTQPDNQYYGVCFSPDNSKLYANDWGHSGENKIYQFDVSSNNANTIISTKTTIAGSSNYFSDIKRGPDGKVYYYSSSSWVGVINDPNKAGMACNPDSTAVRVADNALKDFPNNVPVITIPPDMYSAVDTFICSGEGILTLQPSSKNATRCIWDNGDTARSREVTQAGTYWISYKENGCEGHVDTFHVAVIELNPIITISKFVLSTTSSYYTYQWMLNGNMIPGATADTYTVTENGNYQVIVSGEQGCTDTSEIYKVTNANGIYDVQAIAGTIKIYPNPANDLVYISSPINVNVTFTDISGKVIKKINDASRIYVNDLAAGIYLMQLSDKEERMIKVEKIIKAK